ncbi:helicase-related protein [Paenibacillus sp.]|uniref:helicase-related protein n=1 Tax=Paenibacillus sp. TaxID=58172 RepID=UPI002D36226B|nr:helicase-related protein [Paenibacillus sp.]HZG87382.1 helicase-related protein [Paenibacillus sp.]
MRAVVYGVADAGGWRWVVSIAPEADALWWKRQGADRVWLFGGGRRLSFGQAVELRERLERECPGGPGEAGSGAWVSLREAFGVPTAGWMLDEPAYERWVRRLEGRLLLREEIEAMLDRPEPWTPLAQWGALEGRLRLRRGAERDGAADAGAGAVRGWLRRWLRGWRGRGRGKAGRWARYRCVRCGFGLEAPLPLADCAVCGEPCPYCEACLTMGRVRFCALLVQGVGGGSSGAGSGSASAVRPLGAGGWGLSPAQAEAASAALDFLGRPGGGSFLLWAVTGAGKTETMFPLVERTLRAGGRALVATPRKDVVLELVPRFRAAFPAERVVALYGGSEDRWASGSLTIATTHQLFRFREAFDLVVLDEVDAFPYRGDAQLAFAAEGAARRGGKFVLLSATPPAELREAARRGRLPHAKVCVRFHGRPLPVPRRLALPPLRRWKDAAPPPALREAIAASLRRGAQLFVFVPHIAVADAVARLLRAAFPEAPVAGTSSKDEERAAKVQAFRDGGLRIIVSTTILERGVTVPKTDVFILDADSSLFDDASLVQMAGRAGRKREEPDGNVYFCSSEWTSSQRQAIRDIRAMNALARKKGYLTHEGR